LFPSLFNIYIYDFLREWKSEENFKIWLNTKTPLNTLLFADDQIIIQENEDQVQRALYKLNVICKMYTKNKDNGIQRKFSNQK
jgi:hypothetical protein